MFSGYLLQIDRTHYESEAIHQNGETVILDIHSILIRDEEGNVVGSTGNARDITDRKIAEQKLLKTQQDLIELTTRFQISTEAAKIGIWDIDMSSSVVLWDETMYELHGRRKEDFIITRESWCTLVNPEDMERLNRIKELLPNSEKTLETEYRVIWPDQSIHHMKSISAIQRDKEGNIERVIGTNWDITKEKEAERQKIRAKQLEVKNKELEQFAYVASHDLKEPLRTVKGFAELVKSRYQDKLDDKASEYLGFISAAATRMDKLIKALLDYSRIGHKKKLTTVFCDAIIKEIRADLAVQISECNAEFEIEKLPQIEGYETEIRVLFQNLISNAIKFRKTNVTPMIEISVQKKSSCWQFCIADNGIGVEAEFQDKIFIIFQRLHTREKYEGTGIGLAHCQKIVDLHNGKIWIESEIGKGSSFYFTIPHRNLNDF